MTTEMFCLLKSQSSLFLSLNSSDYMSNTTVATSGAGTTYSFGSTWAQSRFVVCFLLLNL